MLRGGGSGWARGPTCGRRSARLVQVRRPRARRPGGAGGREASSPGRGSSLGEAVGEHVRLDDRAASLAPSHGEQTASQSSYPSGIRPTACRLRPSQRKQTTTFFFRRLCTAVSPRCALRSSQKESSPASTLAASSAGTRLRRRGRRGPRRGRASAFQVDRILRRVRGAPHALPAGKAEGGVLLASWVLAPLLASQVGRVRWLASDASLWLPARKLGGGLLLAALVLAPLVHHVGRVQWLVSGAPLGLPAERRGRFRARREIIVDRGRR